MTFMCCEKLITLADMEVYERLKRWREAYGLTQEGLALSLSIPRTTYANYEVGRAALPEKHMDLLKRLGFDPGLDEPEIIRPRATMRQLKFIINILASPSVTQEEREMAKAELVAALGLPSDFVGKPLPGINAGFTDM